MGYSRDEEESLVESKQFAMQEEEEEKEEEEGRTFSTCSETHAPVRPTYAVFSVHKQVLFICAYLLTPGCFSLFRSTYVHPPLFLEHVSKP